MKKKLAVILLVALLFVDCKKNSPEKAPNPLDQQGAVSIFSSLGLDVKTKSGDHSGGTGDATGDAEVLSNVKIQVIGSRHPQNINTYGDIFKSASSDLLDQTLELNEEGKGVLPVKILYPELEVIDEGFDTYNAVINVKAFTPPITKLGDTVVRDVDSVWFRHLGGRVDVMTTQLHQPGGTYSNPLTGQGSAAEGKGPVSLSFHHLLSKVSFKIAELSQDAGDRLAAQTAWGNIQSIELIDYPSAIKLNLTTNIVNVIEGRDTIIVVHAHKDNDIDDSELGGWGLGNALDLNTNNDCLHGYALVPPGKSMTIRVRSTKMKKGLIVTFVRDAGILEIGKHHTFTLVLTEKMGVLLEGSKTVAWEGVEDADLEF